jgi:hypothetical protein
MWPNRKIIDVLQMNIRLGSIGHAAMEPAGKRNAG